MTNPILNSLTIVTLALAVTLPVRSNQNIDIEFSRVCFSSEGERVEVGLSRSDGFVVGHIGLRNDAGNLHRYVSPFMEEKHVTRTEGSTRARNGSMQEIIFVRKDDEIMLNLHYITERAQFSLKGSEGIVTFYSDYPRSLPVSAESTHVAAVKCVEFDG